MKRIIMRFCVLAALSAAMCSCMHKLCDLPGEVVSVKICGDTEWKYEVTVENIDKDQFFGRFYFYTNWPYQVGDTVYIGQSPDVVCPEDTAEKI